MVCLPTSVFIKGHSRPQVCVWVCVSRHFWVKKEKKKKGFKHNMLPSCKKCRNCCEGKPLRSKPWESHPALCAEITDCFEKLYFQQKLKHNVGTDTIFSCVWVLFSVCVYAPLLTHQSIVAILTSDRAWVMTVIQSRNHGCENSQFITHNNSYTYIHMYI